MYKINQFNRVGIFTPVYFREELVIESLKSLTKSNFKPLQVFLCVGINGASKDFRDFLKEYIINNKTFSYIDVIDPGVNLGKPKMVNLLAKKNERFDFLLSMDSDIQITDPDWLLKLLDVYNIYSSTVTIDDNHKRIGAICANQEGHPVHQAEKLGKMSMKVKNYTITTTKTNQGVAGGVLLTPKYVWKQLGGYLASNIYGSDDGSYAIDCIKNNYMMAYVDEIKCFHPKDKDIKYSEWKLRACNGELEDNEKKGYFETK